MKKTANRKLAKKSVARVAIAAPEIDSLESRILLSGIAPGVDYKKLKYVDADGDKVSISLKKGTFQVTGIFDGKEVLVLDNIDITSLGKKPASAILDIKVANVKPDKDGQGYTDIGSITSSAAGAFKGLKLDGANVGAITLAANDLDYISLSAKAAIKLDRTSPGEFDSVANVNLGAITAKSVDLLQNNGAANKVPGTFPNLNWNGPITILEGATRINGVNSGVYGAVNAESISGINVNTFAAPLTVAKDLTINGRWALGPGPITVGGDLHLSVTQGGITSILQVGGTISGGNPNSTTDAVFIAGPMNVAFVGKTGGTSLSGAFAGLTAVGVGPIVPANSTLTVQSSSIGDISVSGISPGYNLVATLSVGAGTADTATVGNITAVGGGINFGVAGVTAASIGNVTSDAGIAGPLTANVGNIGNVTAKDGSITGNITAVKGAVGDVSATTSAAGGIALNAIDITAGTEVKSVTGKGTGAGGVGAASLDVFAPVIGDVTLEGTAAAPGGPVTASTGFVDLGTVAGLVAGGTTKIGNITAVGNFGGTGLYLYGADTATTGGAAVGNIEIKGEIAGQNSPITFENIKSIASIKAGQDVTLADTGATVATLELVNVGAVTVGGIFSAGSGLNFIQSLGAFTANQVAGAATTIGVGNGAVGFITVATPSVGGVTFAFNSWNGVPDANTATNVAKLVNVDYKIGGPAGLIATSPVAGLIFV